MRYRDFIESKTRKFIATAIPYTDRNPSLYPFQSEIVARALDKGRYSIFADCGLGKTLMEMEWATNVPGRVLLLAPIAVGDQMQREAERFGFDASVFNETPRNNVPKICITNYEKLHRFDPGDFSGVVLDESSILKSYTGKIRNQIIRLFGGHKYKLAATATPAPNDFMEMGNHAEFMGSMTRSEMLSMFFVHDGGSTQDWRLKGHARSEYWKWIGSWATMIRSPADLGYDASGFDLPDMYIHHDIVQSKFDGSALIPGVASLDLHQRRMVRRSSMGARVDRASEIDDGDSMLFWCDLNDESTALRAAIPDAVEVRGSSPELHKRDALVGFSDGSVRAIVTKPRIAGWGMNWQRCARMAFVGLSDSYESFYQATRRCWRYGQHRAVNVHIIYSEHERAVIENVLRKESQHREMQDALVAEANRE